MKFAIPLVLAFSLLTTGVPLRAAGFDAGTAEGEDMLRVLAELLKQGAHQRLLAGVVYLFLGFGLEARRVVCVGEDVGQLGFL